MIMYTSPLAESTTTPAVWPGQAIFFPASVSCWTMGLEMLTQLAAGCWAWTKAANAATISTQNVIRISQIYGKSAAEQRFWLNRRRLADGGGPGIFERVMMQHRAMVG